MKLPRFLRMPETLRAREENPAAVKTLIPEPEDQRSRTTSESGPRASHPRDYSASALLLSTVIPDFNSVYTRLPH